MKHFFSDVIIVVKHKYTLNTSTVDKHSIVLSLDDTWENTRIPEHQKQIKAWEHFGRPANHWNDQRSRLQNRDHACRRGQVAGTAATSTRRSNCSNAFLRSNPWRSSATTQCLVVVSPSRHISKLFLKPLASLKWLYSSRKNSYFEIPNS